MIAYEIEFIEIGTEGNHTHFLARSAPTYSPTKIVTIIKSILAKKIFERHPESKKVLWGGEFRSGGHFASAESKRGNEEIITNYVKSQGADKNYRQLYKITDDKQLDLFSE